MEDQELWEALTETCGILTDFARQLKGRPEIEKADLFPPSPQRRTLYFAELLNGDFQDFDGYEFGVSALLHDGSCINWWLEVGVKGTMWFVNYRVTRFDLDEDERHISFSFPSNVASSLEGFKRNLHNATTDLIATTKAGVLPNN